jgi:type I restriction enzyme M protein
VRDDQENSRLPPGYYQRAFRAITTGHSNRRRTQVADFEALEICFPECHEEQRALIADIIRARRSQQEAANTLKAGMIRFSDVIDGRGDEEFVEIQDKDFEAEPE